MLSAYSWSQFGLFVLGLGLLYYGVVGLWYYRPELTALLSLRRPGSPAPADPAAGGVAPPPLVRPTSAFAPAAPLASAVPAREVEAEMERPADGAGGHLPPEAGVGAAGKMPASPAAATSSDESPAAARTEVPGSDPPEDQVVDEIRADVLDQPEQGLTVPVRQHALLPADEVNTQFDAPIRGPKTVPAVPLGPVYEPLAFFEESVASPLDLLTAAPAAHLMDAASVPEYIARLQAGQNPEMPAALEGTSLAAQMAQHLDQYHAELSALFEEDEA